MNGLLVQIPLDLSAHCVETELKRVYEKSLAAYFKSDAQTRSLIEPTIAVLSQLLERLNFPKLRSTYPALAGSTEAAATLRLGQVPPAILLDGTEIRLFFKSK